MKLQQKTRLYAPLVFLVFLKITMVVSAQYKQENKPSFNAAAYKTIHEYAAKVRAPSLAPTLIRNFSVEHFASAQGFANEGVKSILQDRHGFLWVLTERSLYRYNGQSFRRYLSNAQDSTALLPHPYGNGGLYEDRDGTLWIACLNGLQRYDAGRDCFVRVSLGASASSSLTPADITAINGDKTTGNLWLGVGEEVWLFHPATHRVLRRYAVPRSGGTERRNVHSLTVDSLGRVWATRWDDHIVSMLESSTQEFHTVLQLPFEPVSGSVCVHQDSLWVGSINGVLLYSIRERRMLTSYALSNHFSLSAPAPQVSQVIPFDLCRDNEGRIWVATWQGLALIHPHREGVQFFRHEPLNERSLTTNNINTIYQDRSGIIWIGEAVYGLHKYTPLKYKFQLYRHNPFNDQSLSNNYIRGILEDRRGNLWVGTQFGGLNMLERATGKWTHFRYDSTRPRGITSDHVRGLCEDRNGILWVALHEGWLCSIDTRHPERGFTHHIFAERSFKAQSLYEDREGYLWIGTSTSQAALYRLSPDRKTVEFMHKTHLMPSGIAEMEHIMEDRTGAVCIATTGGLLRYDRRRRIFDIFRHNVGDSTSLPNNFVTHITETRSGELWMATKGGGICRFNPTTETFSTVSVREGLPHENCYAIVEDEQENFWISTDNGLCLYSPSRKTFRRFGEEEGLQGDEFNRFAHFRSKSGEMFLGGVDGLNSFFPSEIRINTIPPKPAVERIQSIAGVLLADNISLLARQTVEIPPQTGFMVDVAALEFTVPEKNWYSWHLDGVDTAWSPESTASHHHQALYPNLAPGEYTFRLRVANADKVWSKDDLMLTIVVLPAWWQTWYARVGFALGLVGSVLLLLRWRVRTIEARSRALQALVHRRTEELLYSNEELQTTNERLSTLNMEMQEIIGIVSHDLKNPITAIRGLSELVHSGFSEGEQAQEISMQISRTADRMLELVKNILDINRLESGLMQMNIVTFSIAPIVENTLWAFTEPAAAKNITVHFSNEAPDALVRADEQAMIQVLDNLISNAVKYSPHGKTIVVRLTTSPDAVRLEVVDEGPGVSDNDMKKLFGKFARLSARPTGGEHSTGLGLSIVKKMVEAMSGKVWCESEAGKGATFIVELPRV